MDLILLVNVWVIFIVIRIILLILSKRIGKIVLVYFSILLVIKVGYNYKF